MYASGHSYGVTHVTGVTPLNLLIFIRYTVILQWCNRCNAWPAAPLHIYPDHQNVRIEVHNVHQVHALASQNNMLAMRDGFGSVAFRWVAINL